MRSRAVGTWDTNGSTSDHSTNFLRFTGTRSGRTHQVRVHLAAIGHPLCGDVDYGWKRASWQASAEAPRRPLLHSWKLSLRHPSTGELLSWQAEPPEDFARATLAAGVVQSLSS